MMNERERLASMIRKAARELLLDGDWNFKEICDGIADYLLRNNVAVLPFTVGDAVDKIFSHNQIVAIWRDEDSHYSKRLWKGMGWDIPEEYKSMIFKCIFGTVPETINEADIINILAEQALKGDNEE